MQQEYRSLKTKTVTLTVFNMYDIVPKALQTVMHLRHRLFLTYWIINIYKLMSWKVLHLL